MKLLYLLLFFICQDRTDGFNMHWAHHWPKVDFNMDKHIKSIKELTFDKIKHFAVKLDELQPMIKSTTRYFYPAKNDESYRDGKEPWSSGEGLKTWIQPVDSSNTRVSWTQPVKSSISSSSWTETVRGNEASSVTRWIQTEDVKGREPHVTWTASKISHEPAAGTSWTQSIKSEEIQSSEPLRDEYTQVVSAPVIWSDATTLPEKEGTWTKMTKAIGAFDSWTNAGKILENLGSWAGNSGKISEKTTNLEVLKSIDNTFTSTGDGNQDMKKVNVIGTTSHADGLGRSLEVNKDTEEGRGSSAMLSSLMSGPNSESPTTDLQSLNRFSSSNEKRPETEESITQARNTELLAGGRSVLISTPLQESETTLGKEELNKQNKKLFFDKNMHENSEPFIENNFKVVNEVINVPIDDFEHFKNDKIGREINNEDHLHANSERALESLQQLIKISEGGKTTEKEGTDQNSISPIQHFFEKRLENNDRSVPLNIFPTENRPKFEDTERKLIDSQDKRTSQVTDALAQLLVNNPSSHVDISLPSIFNQFRSGSPTDRREIITQAAKVLGENFPSQLSSITDGINLKSLKDGRFFPGSSKITDKQLSSIDALASAVGLKLPLASLTGQLADEAEATPPPGTSLLKDAQLSASVSTPDEITVIPVGTDKATELSGRADTLLASSASELSSTTSTAGELASWPQRNVTTDNLKDGVLAYLITDDTGYQFLLPASALDRIPNAV